MKVSLNRVFKKPLRYFAKRLFPRETPLSTSTIQKSQQWSIGIYVGESPFALRPSENADNPVLTRANVSDVPATFVADPFMIRVETGWCMFFEVMNPRTGKGEIGYATSDDGLKWTYRHIVLVEPFHLSYPYVFEWRGSYYMIPESCEARAVRLYRAGKFPVQWSFVGTLLCGPYFADSSIFTYQGRLWMFTETNREAKHDTLRLYMADDLAGPWLEHPQSPIVQGNPHIARPAGRVLVLNEKIVRFTQDCYPTYGTQVRAFKITELTDTKYEEQEVCNTPILKGSGTGWNESGMHHIDPLPMEGGRWIACVDGFSWRESRAELSGESKLPTNTMTRLKHYLRNYEPYIVASEIKSVLKEHLRGANKHFETRSLKPEKPSRGNVLLSYVTDAFTLSPGQTVPISHTAYWEALQMAKTYLEFGYCIDVISADDAARFLPKKQYAVFVGHRHNFETIARRLNTDCVKVLHCDVAHWLFHNSANASRLLALQRRKGVTLPPVKDQVPNLAIERADCATVLGNEFTISTFRYANKPMYRVPISAPVIYPWPEGKDFEACRRHFLWLGSHGFVHKGLDLVLEAFSAMPEYHLTVCGPIKGEVEKEFEKVLYVEKDFEKAFYNELYQTSNIRTVGWIDVASPEFMQIANDCVALIYPSCSEGQSGGVITCMHAGLIPIVSYESGVDVEEFGAVLQDCSVDNIKNSIRTVASLSAQALRKRARRAWEFARANHTREKFAEEYRKCVGAIISTYDPQADCDDSTSHKRLDNTAHHAVSTQGKQ